jgi:hypothetical protein
VALTVTTDLTSITDAESLTGWLSYGAGGAGAMALEPDYRVQGGNCISRGVSGAINKGQMFDLGAGGALDFNSGTHQDKLIYIWMRTSTLDLCDTIANGGVRVILGSGTTTPGDAAGVWSAWYVDGSNTIEATDGFTCYVIDPQSTPSATFGGGVDLNAVRYIGGVQRSTTTAKGQNFAVDRICYGRGELRVTGTVTTAGSGFAEIAAADFGDKTNGRFGITTVKSGVIFVRGKIVIGHASTSTTFSSYGEQVVFESPHYHNGTNIVRSIPDASVGSVTGSDGRTSYVGLGFIGGSGTTAIDFGLIVGADRGRSGPVFTCPNNTKLTTPAKTLATVAASNDAITLALYGTTFKGFEGGVDLRGTNLSGDDCYGNTFDACGRLDSNMEIRNCNVLNSTAVATDGAVLWGSDVDVQNSLFAGNSRAIVFEATTGTPFAFTGLTFSSNTYDVRNESGGSITIDVSGGTTPTHEESGGGSATTVNSTIALTISANVSLVGAEVRIYDLDTTPPDYGTELAGTESHGSATYVYSGTSGNVIVIQIMLAGYEEFVQQTTMPTVNGTLPIVLTKELNA